MNISRRRLLVRTGWVAGGLTVVGLAARTAIPPLPTFAVDDSPEATMSWVQLLPSGAVRFLLPRAELGQGIATGLSQVVAEELYLPLSRIDCRYQSTAHMAPCQMTVGSQSVENYLLPTARAAAGLREALRHRAALRFGRPADEVELIEGGFIAADRKTLALADLLEDGESEVLTATLAPDLELYSRRERAEQRSVGRVFRPLDIEQIVTGAETFSRDVRLDNVRYGAIARPPQLGARLEGFDAAAALKVEGVEQVVEHDGQLGLVATTPAAAARALQALNARWRPLTSTELRTADRALDIDAFIAEDRLDHRADEAGSLPEGANKAAHVLSLRYDSPMAAHAAMEPRSGTAHYRRDGNGEAVCDIWTGCQDPWLVQAAAAKAIGLGQSRVRVHNHRVGGAFGGRVLCQASVEAAWLSRASGMPVKVQWSREEEFRHNYVGPQYSSRIDAGVDEHGKVSHWHHRAVGAPILTSSTFLPPYLRWLADRIPDPGTSRGVVPPYTFENRRIEFADERLPMPTGPWRGLGAAPNTFAVECAVDELAVAAGTDPIEFRLRHLNDPRLASCLARLREVLGTEAGRYGIAATAYKGVTFVAIGALVTAVSDRLRVRRMICVQDCGTVISPDLVRAQIEGNLVWGTGMALTESLTIEDGAPSADNFDRYHPPRLSDVPELDVHLLDSDLPPSGAAEAAIAPAAAAIANGVFRTTGQRRRALPISWQG